MQTVQHRASSATTHLTAKGIAVATVRLLLSWQERARQRRHLSSLDDRALKDIGLNRADAAGESIKPFWRG